MKKILLVFLSILLASCSINDRDNENIEKPIISNEISNEVNHEKVSTSSEEKSLENDNKNTNYSYKMDKDKTYKRDKSLYVNRMLFTYPSEISAKEGDPYSIDDLKNLDYNKNLYYGLLNFRIPQRTKVFSHDKDLYAIDFPKNEDYNITIFFKKIFEDGRIQSSKTKELLLPTTLNFMETIKEKNEEKVIQKPFEISNPQMDAYYFIGQTEKYTHTYVFVASPNNIVFFDIVEERKKSNVSKYIMADFLSTMYIETEDPISVKKNLDSFEDKIDLYATEKIDFGNFSLKIPENMKTLQDDDKFKAFSKEVKGEVVSQILLIKIPKGDKKSEELSLEDMFNKTSGTNLPPAYIVSMGQIKEEKIKDLDALTSEIRIYMDNYTAQGVKVCVETDTDFLTIIITGPISNSNEIRLLTKNILNTLDFQ